MARSIGGKHPDLTIFHLPQRATVLPRHAHGVLALFDKARLIKHQHALGVAHLVRHQAMVCLAHLVFIPYVIAHAALHPRMLPPSTWSAIGSIDLRSRTLHWPTM